jgi:hypothetical protein
LIVRARSSAEIPVEVPWVASMVRGVVPHLGLQVQALADPPVHGQADEPPAMRLHEGDGLGGDEVRGDDEVALVLAVGIVHQNHHFALGHVLDGLGNRAETHRFLLLLGGKSPKGVSSLLEIPRV